MSVRAKFYCTEISKMIGGGKVRLSAVTRGEDNKKWASATPAGTIEMSIRNELAIEQFDVGEEYYVDFSPAPKGQEGMGD
jgi:hypothetical protein